MAVHHRVIEAGIVLLERRRGGRVLEQPRQPRRAHPADHRGLHRHQQRDGGGRAPLRRPAQRGPPPPRRAAVRRAQRTLRLRLRAQRVPPTGREVRRPGAVHRAAVAAAVPRARAPQPRRADRALRTRVRAAPPGARRRCGAAAAARGVRAGRRRASASRRRPRQSLGETRLPPHLPPDLADDLPEGPGVYLFRGEGGALLYVGKSRNLRSRVLEHFASEHRSGKEAKLTRQVRGVEWVETGGELGALLLESRLVKDLAPSANRRLRKPAGLQCVRLESAAGGLEVRIEPLEASARRRRVRAVRPVPHGARRAARARGQGARGGPVPQGHGTRARRGLVLRAAARPLPRRLRRPGTAGAARCAAAARARLAAHEAVAVPGAIGIRERGAAGEGSVLHVIDRWRHLGTAARRGGGGGAARARAPDAAFDPDGYRIVARCLERVAPRDLVMLGGGRA